MINKSFITAHNLQIALQELSDLSKDYLIIAGGTDVIVSLRNNNQLNKSILDMSSVDELKKISYKDGTLIIGALCTHSEIEKNLLIKEYAPMLAKGSSCVGSTLIRNRGTIGGNIVNNASCADTIPSLVLMDADVVIENKIGRRRVNINDFLLEKEKVQINKDEIVTFIEVKPLINYKWEYIKVGRRNSLAISRLTLAIALKEKKGVIEDLRVCPGAMLPKCQRLVTTESKYKNRELGINMNKDIAKSAVNEAISISGLRWSTEYKQQVLYGLIYKVLTKFTEGN